MISLLKISHLKILKSPALWISLIFIIFFMAFSPKAISASVLDRPAIEGVFDPIEEANKMAVQISSAIMITGLLITVITSFGESFVKIKGSLIYQNVQLNNKPKYQFYLATILPVVTYSILVFVTSLILLVTFDFVGIIGQTSNIVDWANIQYLYLIISLVLTVTLGISIALLLATISKTENTYTALVWAYLFLVFFFGGSSVPLFLIRGDDPLAAFTYLSMAVPSTFSNFMFINSMTNNIDFSSGELVYILDIVMPIVLSGTFIGIRQLILLKQG